MRKVLLTLIAVLMAVPAFAVEVYNNGENAVGIYGTFRGYMGYGLGTNGTSTNDGTTSTTVNSPNVHNMMYGLQNNSRIGVNIKIGQFTSQAELGANEKTFYLTGTANTLGLRQMWGAWTFNNGSRLLFGKTATPTSMAGFSADFYDLDGGLKGYGGNATSTRRFQIQYTIKGITLALIEDDILSAALPTTFTSGGKYTPRGSIGYDYKSDSLTVRVAATYTARNGTYTKADGTTQAWTNLHAFGIVAGAKPSFNDGKMWVSVQGRYGMNEDLYGEAFSYYNLGTYAHSSYAAATSGRTVNANDGSFYNVHRANIMAEFGMKLTNAFTAAVGAGYQATIPEFEQTAGEDKSHLIHNYGIYLQGQYHFSKNFAIIPQISWYGSSDVNKTTSAGVTSTNTTDYGALLIGAQFRATF